MVLEALADIEALQVVTVAESILSDFSHLVRQVDSGQFVTVFKRTGTDGFQILTQRDGGQRLVVLEHFVANGRHRLAVKLSRYLEACCVAFVFSNLIGRYIDIIADRIIDQPVGIALEDVIMVPLSQRRRNRIVLIGTVEVGPAVTQVALSSFATHSRSIAARKGLAIGQR